MQQSEIPRRVTVYDVAAELGISVSTVSRVLNNSVLIGEERRRLILETAERLGYEKRVIRRQSRRSILTIRLFLPRARCGYVHLFYDPADLIDGITEGFADVRLNLVTSMAGEEEGRDSKKLGDVDGAIFAFTAASGREYEDYSDRTIPLVEINRGAPDRNFTALDHAAGMRTLFQRAVSLRSPLMVSYIGFTQVPYVNDLRREGFLAAAREAGYPAERVHVRQFSEIGELGVRSLHELLDRGTDVFFCFNDVLAARLYAVAGEAGLSPPRDFGLTGFDNSPLLDLIPRRIDTVELSVFELGRRAAAWLRRCVIDKHDEALREYVSGRLVPGETLRATPLGRSPVGQDRPAGKDKQRVGQPDNHRAEKGR